MVQEVKYATEYKTQAVTDAELTLIKILYSKLLYSKSLKVDAAMFARDQYGLDLYEAEKLCEAIAAL